LRLMGGLLARYSWMANECEIDGQVHMLQRCNRHAARIV
jgi:hypothetical protein